MEDKYLKGFNSGYLMRKYDPILSKEIVSIQNFESEYLEGLRNGMAQMELEIEGRLKSIVKEKEAKKSKGYGRSRDSGIGFS